jgi:hypothetical protein
MWNPLRTEVVDRFSAVESFFKATSVFRGDDALSAKGLAFVQIYAAYEFSVRAVVRTAVDAIKLHGHKAQELIPSLMALFMDAELTSLRDCGIAKVWESRIKLFDRLFSEYPASIPNTVFPRDGTHYRHGQLLTIFKVFSINRPPAQRRNHLHLIDTMVNHRNDIAHGLETASNIGRRYSRGDILQMNRQIKSVCLLLISAIEKKCSHPPNVRRDP